MSENSDLRERARKYLGWTDKGIVQTSDYTTSLIRELLAALDAAEIKQIDDSEAIQHERMRMYEEGIKAGRDAAEREERERCIKAVEMEKERVINDPMFMGLGDYKREDECDRIIAAIRREGGKG